MARTLETNSFLQTLVSLVKVVALDGHTYEREAIERWFLGAESRSALIFLDHQAAAESAHATKQGG